MEMGRASVVSRGAHVPFCRAGTPELEGCTGRDRDEVGSKVARMVPRTVAAKPDDAYAALYRGLHWAVPEHFNIAEVCCSRWARDTPQACAIVCSNDNDNGNGSGTVTRHSYAELQAAANRL